VAVALAGADVVGAGDVEAAPAGRDAISTPLAGNPVNVDVPPGRYWPAGDAIRTVAVVGVAVGAEFAIGAVAGADVGAIPYRSDSALVLAILEVAARAAVAAGELGELVLGGLGALAAWGATATRSLFDMFEFGGAPAVSGASGTIEYRSGSLPIDGVNAP
jgi:hypothetical protein